jgi:GNAT superfamily N-acetyltransferase
MSDSWMPSIKLRMTRREWEQLPRNAAYRYEYSAGYAYLSPHPKHYHALLDLQPMEVSGELDISPVRLEDFADLVPLFADVFRTIQPYGSLDEMTRCEAARQALERTRLGGDGPWIEEASFLVREGGTLGGAIFITLLPQGDPCDWDSYRWQEPPPKDCIARRVGRPHLTWIFVSPWRAGQGVGTALLARAANALLRLGYTELLSTFMIGNDSSMLWHWRNGFRLLTYPGSYRRYRQMKGRRPKG